jgi:hypothetical protein
MSEVHWNRLAAAELRALVARDAVGGGVPPGGGARPPSTPAWW